MRNGPESLQTHENAPRLKTVSLEGSSIGVALAQVANGAGEKELAWVLAPENFKATSIVLQGSVYYYFPNARKNGNSTWCVSEHNGKFEPHHHKDTEWWLTAACAVIIEESAI